MTNPAHNATYRGVPNIERATWLSLWHHVPTMSADRLTALRDHKCAPLREHARAEIARRAARDASPVFTMKA